MGTYLFEESLPDEFGTIHESFSTMLLVALGGLRVYSKHSICCEGNCGVACKIFFVSFCALIDLILLQVQFLLAC